MIEPIYHTHSVDGRSSPGVVGYIVKCDRGGCPAKETILLGNKTPYLRDVTNHLKDYGWKFKGRHHSRECKCPIHDLDSIYDTIDEEFKPSKEELVSILRGRRIVFQELGSDVSIARAYCRLLVAYNKYGGVIDITSAVARLCRIKTIDGFGIWFDDEADSLEETYKLFRKELIKSISNELGITINSFEEIKHAG